MAAPAASMPVPTASAQTHSREHLHARLTLGQRVADRLAAALGSWSFILTQNWFVLGWMLWNTVTPWKFDPPPFIGLNLLFSWQASNTGPVLQMTGNRQAAIDRARDDHEAQEVEALFALQNTQMEMLGAIRELTAEIRELVAAHRGREA